MEKIGVTPSVAQDFIATLEYQFICDWLTVVLDKPEEEFTEGRPAYLVKALRENWQLPDTFLRKEADRQEAQRQEQERQRLDQQQKEEARIRAEERKRLFEQHTPQAIPGTDLTTTSAWHQTLEKLREEIPPATYETWLKDTMLLSVADNAAQVMVSSQFAVAWLERRMYQSIARTLGDVLNQDIDVQFIPTQ